MNQRNIKRSGGCQCGAVRYSAQSIKDNAHVCHCRMCQKASGNFFASLVGVPHKDFTWTQGEASFFQSSGQVKRGFCAQCGTPLYFQHADSQHISLFIGSFDQPKTILLDFECGMEGRMPQLDQLQGDLPNYGSTEQAMEKYVVDIQKTNHQHPDHD